MAAAAGAGGFDMRTLVKDATQKMRLDFVRKVYGILTAQLLVTVAIAAPLSQAQQFVKDNVWLLGVSAAVTLITICAMTCGQQVARTYPTNYIFLLLFTACEGVVIGFVSAQYTWQSVVLAAFTTAAIFVCMTAYACMIKTDFTGCGPYLFAGLMVLCMFGFVLSILSLFGVTVDWAIMLHDISGVLIFTFYIVFDTQLILGEYGGHKVQFSIDDYVFASLNLYLDIINLFLRLLRLRRSRSKGQRRD